MNIQHTEKDNQGSFFIEKDGKQLAEMVYNLNEPGQLVIEHTEVDDELRGQNIGYELVVAGANYAREKQLKVVPVCRFARALFHKKKEEFADVAAAEY
ncbi:MAG: hypothetical protein JWQ27_797 [Ferruginibacter sp.]|nr:hypothetical protein [Ferruginibacter sp.]